MMHDLKIIKQYFEDVINDIKTFEVRKNDRDFKIGDIVNLREIDDGEYTGRSCSVCISYILDDNRFCKRGFVVFGFRKIESSDELYERNRVLGCKILSWYSKTKDESFAKFMGIITQRFGTV